MPNLLWFRRDLRLADHPALIAALDAGPTLPLFVIDPALWNRSGPRRLSYLAASLRSLDRAIRDRGGPGLAIHAGDPSHVVPALAMQYDAEVFTTRDAGPYGGTRDRAVADRCPLTALGSPYLHDPGSVTKPDSTPYRVFTPFYRAWSQMPQPDALPAPNRWPQWPQRVESGQGWRTIEDVEVPPFPVGEEAARQRWARFAESELAGYPDARDLPAREGTSGLSAALKFGELHPRSIVADARPRPGGLDYVRQLCWRDFYGHLLAANPRTARENVQPVFDSFRWERGPDADRAFDDWRRGSTGYPFVDAGMRQLAAEGTMHNRLRMVVASFLVKDLHVDWRRGAAYFMQQLYDGDLANNQYGWQWVSGTGTDAAPYYRIFNPVTQGLRFDPDGQYVRRWVPQLRGLAGATVHEPWKRPREAWSQYPERIVDHGRERQDAMARYAAAKQAGSPGS